MKSRSTLILLCIIDLFQSQCQSQSFVNGDLEGVVDGTSSMPADWFLVPYDDPVCSATNSTHATPDLTDMNGPGYDHGLMGNPYSGATFISGLHNSSYHEGIMQAVSGLVPGTTYTIGFHQTVVKQLSQDNLDPAGCWAVYRNAQLLGITTATFSAEPPISLNKPWELRLIAFTALATSDTLKFLPYDDDTDHSGSDGLRMGIDSIYIIPCTEPLASALGTDTLMCPGEPILLSTGLPNACVWQDGSTSSSFTASQAGIYWVDVETSCGIQRDSIVISYAPHLQLGFDQWICDGDSLVLDATIPYATYSWYDGTTTAEHVAHTEGLYWVQVTSPCGMESDSVSIHVDFPLSIDLGSDEVLCDGDSLLLNAEVAHGYYLWQNWSTAPELLVTAPGTYWVHIDNECGLVGDTITVAAGPQISLDLGPDRVACAGEEIILNVLSTDAWIEWQDGSNGPTLPVDTSGTYWVVVSSDGCEERDTVSLRFEDCDFAYDCTQNLVLYQMEAKLIINALYAPILLQVFDTRGRLAMDRGFPIGESAVDISGLARGIYCIKHTGCDIMRKILIQ